MLLNKELKIARDEQAGPDRWDSFVEQSPYATYFHTREWAEIWAGYTDGQLKPAARLLTFEDGIQALFPLSVERVTAGLLQQYMSSPAWAYGGWLSDTNLTPSHHRQLWQYATRLNLIMRQNPFDPALAEAEFPWSWQETTHVMDLRGGLAPIMDFWQHGRSGIARKARKATRSGVKVEEATSLEDWQKYFQAYQASQERWGKVLGIRFEWRLFEELFRRKSSKIKLWLAKLEGEVTCGAICLYHQKHVAYWHGAGYEKYFDLRPVNLLHTHIIEQACREGYWWYDFGISSGVESVAAFKASFGGQKMETNMLISKNLPRRTLDRAKEIISFRSRA